MTYFTINMDYFSKHSDSHNVFTSRRFTSRDEAREAMEFMQEMGFHKSVDEHCFANYTIVTYTRHGDVVNAHSYDEEVFGEEVRSPSLVLRSRNIVVKPRSRNRRRTKNTIRKTRSVSSQSSPSLRRSARISSKNSSPVSSPSSSDSVNTINVSNGRHYEAYGRGYLLYPSGVDDPDYGEKYFHEGFWNVKQNAWFFRERHLDTVKRLCNHKTFHHNTKTAEVSEASSSSSRPRRSSRSASRRSSRRFVARTKKTSRTFERYGRGFLLKPINEDDPDWGEKYYRGGWWMPSQNAWFFKNKSDLEFTV